MGEGVAELGARVDSGDSDCIPFTVLFFLLRLLNISPSLYAISYNYEQKNMSTMFIYDFRFYWRKSPTIARGSVEVQVLPQEGYYAP
jgi:hypothetical protein